MGNQAEQPQQDGFPQFVRLPCEIQDMIFAEAIRHPNIHIVKASRVLVHDNYNANWGLSFSPVPRRQDKSAYRWVADLAAVSRRAHAAVLRATRSSQDKLPFKTAGARFNSDEDLVLVEFPTSRSPTLGFFHPLDQLPGCIFDSLRLGKLALFGMVQKVALKHAWRHPTAHERNCNFRCRVHHHFHHTHNAWRMCPREVFGFLNCLPKLREVYIILEPHSSRDQQRMLTVYIKNFYTCEPPLRHSQTPFLSASQLHVITNVPVSHAEQCRLPAPPGSPSPCFMRLRAPTSSWTRRCATNGTRTCRISGRSFWTTKAR
ncbi:uncharacterized protein B0T15DRAFT_397751 [Chaetomium strumarium]|uniref:2EXR domain-containing protein n=1 Tax=Chaetomium strumarium TaxID=1170767 RepID=A0AAJ0GT50_9PEZI|nr:hypothetical protein B0T15DRAFT_397751 [Chaetomium strumarium]